jgi:predicted amino acid-binding ACT domain protein
MPQDYVLSVMARDRVGIVAALTAAIAELDGNIDAMSQTVLRGYFTIIVTVRFSSDVSAGTLAQAVCAKGGPGELAVSVKAREAAGPAAARHGSERFVLTITGEDRKGIMHRVTSFLASRDVNIEDLYAYVEGEGFRFIGQLEVPGGVDVERLQMELSGLWPPGEMQVSLQHENVFLATNHVDFRHEPETFAGR